MTDYKILNKSFEALCSGSINDISLLSNASAFLNDELGDRCTWCGFYLFNGKELLLGPFQGKVACTPISLDSGVCGMSAKTREPIVVPNVNLFKGHIACDSRSQSEIVIPIVVNDNLYGVLDVDSKYLNTFNEEDVLGMLKFVEILKANLANENSK